MCPSKIVVCQPLTEQKTKKTLFAGDWEDERINVTGCSGGVGGRARSGVQCRRDIFSVVLFRSEQKTKKTLFAGDWEDERINVTGCSGGVGGRDRSGVQCRRDIFSVVLFFN